MRRGNLTFIVLGVLVVLSAATSAQAQSIAVHWDGYAGTSVSAIPPGTQDGIQLPDGSYNANWTNVLANWYGVGSANNVNLQDSTGAATTAAVTCTAGYYGEFGTNWSQGGYSPAPADALLNGPWGANGNGNTSNLPYSEAIPNVITGIPVSYSSYEIIGYLNPPYGPGGNYSVWLDSNPGSSNAANAPVAGSQYYFSPDSGSGTGSTAFVLMTNNSNSSSFTAGNTVVWSGLSGANQTLWTVGLGGGAGNWGFTGFEIVNTTPATPPTWAAAVSGNWSSSGSWTGGPPVPPNSAGVTAVINAATNAALTITLDEPVVIGSLVLGNSGNAGVGYTLSGAGSNTLTLNSGLNSQISVTDGTHFINAPVVLASNLIVTSTTFSPWTLTFGSAGGISDNGAGLSLTMNAANGTLVLAGTNNYSGHTVMSQGILQLGSNQAIQNSVLDTTGAGSLVFSAAVNSPTFGGIIGPNGITLPPQITALTLNVANGTQSYSGYLSASNMTLTKTGSGTQILSGGSSYTGNTSVNNGTLVAATAASLPVGPSNPVSVAAGAALVIQTGDGVYYGWNSGQIDNLLAYTTWGSNASVLGIDTTNGDFTYGSNITQGLSLTKLGTNTLTLTGSNTSYSGATTVSAGSLQLGDGSSGDDVSLQTSSITNNSALLYNVAVSQSGGYTISGNGRLTKLGIGMLTLTGAVSYSGPTNVNAGGVSISSGTLGTFNHNLGAGTSTIGAGVSVAAVNVNDGTVNFNSTQANGGLTLPANSTGTVVVGPSSGGRLPTVAFADFSQTPSTGTVNAGNPLAITSVLKLPGGTPIGTTVTLSNGTSFTATGANLANTSIPSTLTIGGGKLTIAPTEPSIGLHWSGYANSTTTPVTGIDGVVPQGNWTNVGANWYAGGGFGTASNLIDNSGATTPVAVTSTSITSNGTYWKAGSSAAGVSNLLIGPGGGNGGGNGSVTSTAIPNIITGIPYTNYEIIAYVNNTDYAGQGFSVWLDSNPASSNGTNAPVAGSQYYYSSTYTNPVGFVQLTNNSNPASYPSGNYVVWTGLTGSSQTLWTDGWTSAGQGTDANEGITSFQIVNLAPQAVNLPVTAISATSSSTLDLGETGGTPTLNHTLGALCLTAGTAAGGTQLQVQNGLNINFNGISATYPAGGTGAATASIVNGSTAPVISLASSSSVSVDPNVTLTIGTTIGDSPTSPTTLDKTGNGTLMLTGTNTYTGGTVVTQGTLIVQDPGAIAGGTSLTVGNASAFHAPIVPASAAAPVPEPGAWAILATGIGCLLVYRRRRQL